MAAKYLTIAKKLQTACKQIFGVRLLIDQRQWYHVDRDRPMTVYTLYQVTISDKSKSSKIELFKTYSQIQLVLFMRDLWYELNGWEIPHDNETWEEMKEKYGKQREPSNELPADGERDKSGFSKPGGSAICDELYTGWKRNRSGKYDTGVQ